MRPAALVLAVALGAVAHLAAAQAPVSPSITGDWDGGVKAPAGIELPLTLHFAPAGATLDSPDQNAAGVAVSVSQEANKVVVEIPASRARFTGTLSADGQTMSGSLNQSGFDMPAHFTRRAPGARPLARDRAQTPHPPFPYAVREVSFEGEKGVALAGTLSQPYGAGPFPAVVMIAGSGPQNRDENVEGHKIFAVIADRLTRAGVAVLRYDKRGIGGSKGDYADATTADFAADAADAFAWLRTQPEIAPDEVGLVGHSEGAEIASSVADADPRVAFVVLLSAPAVPGEQIILSQQKAILLASGAPPVQVRTKGALERRVLDAALHARSAAAAADAAERVLASAGAPGPAAAAEARQVASPWFRAFLNDDPAPALRALRQPVLVVAGSKDLQVLPALNLPVIGAALANNKAAKIVELEGLNHLLQPANTGAPSEYGTITTSVAPAALDLITDWIVARTR